jgi:hypothetical protein
MLPQDGDVDLRAYFDVISAIDLLYEFIAVYIHNMQMIGTAKNDYIFSLHHKHILHPEPQTSVVAQLRPLTQLR